jgi:radical SAM protein with 4Fe4S-binding SPASM domain
MDALFVKKALPYRQIDGLSIIHRGEQRIFLNEDGTSIWQLVDGTKTDNDIAWAMGAKIGGSDVVPSLRPKVAQYLTTLSRLGLLEDVDLNGSATAAPQARNPTDLVADSKNMGALSGEAKPIQDICATTRKKTGAISVIKARKEDESLSIEDRFNELYWEKLYIQKMHLELTYRCNFRCIQCYNTTHAGTETEMTSSEWRSALEQMAELGCHTVTFTGGEIFVRKDAVDILQAACDNGFSFRINTNGSLINESLLQRLEPMRPFLQSFDVSFYGATPQIHDSLARRLGAYMATLRAVRLLVEAKMSVFTKFVTMRDNFDGIKKWKQDMRQLGVRHSISTGTLIPRTDRNNEPLVQLLTDDQYKLLLEETPPDESAGAHFCRPGQIRGAITPDGNVSPCEWLTDFKFGNLRERPLRDIWFSPESQSFRNIFEEDSECPSCELRPGCSRCPAHSYLETGNLLKCAPNPRHFAELYQQTKVAQ